MFTDYTYSNRLHAAARVNSRGELVDVETGMVLEFKEDALVEVTFGPDDLVDRRGYGDHGRWRQLDFLPLGTILKVELRLPERVKANGALFDSENQPKGEPFALPAQGAFVVLEDDLKMWYAKGKNSHLAGCKCYIPAMNIATDSLNQAYTMLSSAYELDRRSHTGNVFRKCWYSVRDHTHWLQLDARRIDVENAALKAAREVSESQSRGGG